MIQSKYFFIGCFLLLSMLVGCISEINEPPADIIQQEQMTNILEEVQLIEAFKQRGVVLPPRVKPKKEAEKMYARLFLKYGITKEEFTNSYQWYERNPKLLAEMYDEVLVRLSEKQANVRTPKPTKKQD